MTADWLLALVPYRPLAAGAAEPPSSRLKVAAVGAVYVRAKLAQHCDSAEQANLAARLHAVAAIQSTNLKAAQHRRPRGAHA